MSRRCLVTGAGGFLGRHVVVGLTARGWQVIAATRETLDVTRAVDFERLPEVDAIVHAAAFVPTAAAGLDAIDQALSQSALGTQRALAFAARRGVGRFVYVSSADVYAPEAGLPVDEGAPTGPRGPAASYGLGKLWGDELVRGFGGDGATCLRLTAIHGPGMRPRGVVSAFWRAAGAGEALPVHAPAASGDFLHVDDAVGAVIAALEAPAVSPVYNVGSGVETPLESLARAVWGARRPDPPRLRLGDAGGRRFVLDCARAAAELGWRPQRDLGAGLRAWAAVEPRPA